MRPAYNAHRLSRCKLCEMDMAPLKSVHEAFRLLQAFHEPMEWVSSGELGRRSGLSDAATHRLLETLVDIGVVMRNARGDCRRNPGFQPFTETQGRAPVLTLVSNCERALDRTG